MESLVVSGFFPHTVTIQNATLTRDEYGEPDEAWADATGLVDIPAAIAPAGAGERRTVTSVFLEATHTIALDGVYAVTTRQRAVDQDGNAYDITSVERDTLSVWTRLICRKVTL